MQRKLAHMEMIQGVVNRLSSNSFLLKGWSVVLVSGLSALAAKDTKITFVLLAYFPCVAMWSLDAYFLDQERLFRKLYDRIRVLDPESIDFSMDTSVVKSTEDGWFNTLWRPTLIAFHLPVIVTISLIAAMLLRK